MAMIGVMPIPPPIRMERRASTSGNRLRWTSPDTQADMKAFMDACRAAARGRIEQHAKPVDISVCRISAQRILPDNPRRYLQIDMRAGIERRQRATVGIDQVENDDAGYLLLPPRDQQLEHQLRLCANYLGRRNRLREYS